MKPLVIIESPFGGNPQNVEYAKECMKDSLRRGEAPFASHLLYPQILNDQVSADRTVGMEAGFAWGDKSDFTAIYMDLGVSGGMAEGIQRALNAGKPVVQRWLNGREEPVVGLGKVAYITGIDTEL